MSHKSNEMLELDYPPLKLHSSVDRGLLQTRGQSGQEGSIWWLLFVN